LDVLVLGIETSCDETAAALVEDGRTVLSDVVSTQTDIHQRWGGVVPELASRNHLVQILPVVDEALRRAGRRLTDLDLIAATTGPGLLGALLVGAQVGKALAAALELPFVGVNHLEGHLLAIRLAQHAPDTPFIALVVSGGHTSLYDVAEPGSYRCIGTTRDDAAGEAFDKVAKIIGLPYPGGEPIDRLAKNGDPAAIRFPRALSAPGVFDVSFSGLKTAVLRHVRARGVPSGQALADLCASFQEAVADSLTKKLVAAARKLGRQRILICGGVAANSRLRALAEERARYRDLSLFIPPRHLCTDNGAMIAVAGYEAHQRGAASVSPLGVDAGWLL
jgi:N6-L-threonylcarbamoyladenine synthase